jgi:rubrerythrin
MADQHVFRQSGEALSEKLKNISTPREALKMALDFEKDTIVFFLELQSAAESYDESREQIKKLVNEERKHLQKIIRSLEKFEGGK